MTETLKTVLDREASAVVFAPPDVDAITGAGRRRVRRRRVAAALAGVVAVALVGAAAVEMGGGGGDRETVVASGDGSGVAVSWAVGSTIHVGGDTIEVGHSVRAYVRTSVGFVVLDGADDVWSVTEDGVTEIGRMTSPQPDNLDQQLLASDPGGSLAGWVGEDPSGDLIVETYDQETGESRSFPVPGRGRRTTRCSSPSTTGPGICGHPRGSSRSTSTPVASDRWSGSRTTGCTTSRSTAWRTA